VAIYNKENKELKQIWVRKDDKEKFKKLAKDRKLEFWEMFRDMLKNYKEV
jgi:hypothetical protein